MRGMYLSYLYIYLCTIHLQLSTRHRIRGGISVSYGVLRKEKKRKEKKRKEKERKEKEKGVSSL